MIESMSIAEQQSHAEGHHSGECTDKTALRVFIFLILMTGASYLTSFVAPNPEDFAKRTIFVMAISTAKAICVMLFFMHLKYEGKWKYTMLLPAGILAAVLVFALVPDIGLRLQHM